MSCNETTNVIVVGANDMNEIFKYNAYSTYKKGLFIEAEPEIYLKLEKNLDIINKKKNVNYFPINKLVTSEKGKKYTFNVFNNHSASSSIFKPTELALKEWKVYVKNEIDLVSTTMEEILDSYGWNNIKYDLYIDVQGAELEVLKGFSSNNFNNINAITVEISQKEYYKMGVLFEELNQFLINKNFKLITEKDKIRVHGDVTYVKNI